MATTIAPTINGLALPDWFWQRWDSEDQWIPPSMELNGHGVMRVAPFWSVELRWKRMSWPHFRWWTVSVLGGAYDLICDITYWSPAGTDDFHLTAYSDVHIAYPIYAQTRNSLYVEDVLITFDRIVGPF